jgi:hypothetical protein
LLFGVASVVGTGIVWVLFVGIARMGVMDGQGLSRCVYGAVTCTSTRVTYSYDGSYTFVISGNTRSEERPKG